MKKWHQCALAVVDENGGCEHSLPEGIGDHDTLQS